MAAHATTTENIPAVNTPARWEKVIADLTDKSGNFESETTRLTQERASLVLDAELGDASAAKRLRTMDDRLTAVRRESAVTGEAIEKARERLQTARKAEAAEAEKARQKELREMARAAQTQAREFTAALNQLVAAGTALKVILRNMLQRATREERGNIDRMLETGPWMRAAEATGLRALLEFAPYPGPREHLRSMDQQMMTHLGPLLSEEKERD